MFNDDLMMIMIRYSLRQLQMSVW